MRPIYKTGGVFPPLQNTNDIIKEYFIVRLNYYQKRKDFILKELEKW